MMRSEYNDTCCKVNNFHCLTAYNFVCKTVVMNLSERIVLARTHAKLTQRQLADLSGVTQQSISLLEKGKQKQTTEIVSIAVACGVRSEWLALEQGEMVNGLHIEDERIKRGVTILEQMQADNRLDDAMELLDSIAKFSRKASGENK
jgi:transcriptional regulator with XRE-family HTH domain